MYLEFKYLHSATAGILLIILISAIIYTLFSWLRKKPFSKTNKTIAIVGMSAAHLQVIIGMVLYFLSPLGMSNFSGTAMKDTMSRLYILEHPIMMIIGIVLITIGYMKAKRQTEDRQKFKTIVIFYSLGLLFFLSRIPWATWTL